MEAKKKPKKETKNRVYQVRLTEEEAGLLASVSIETGDTMADVFRNALRMYANFKRNYKE